MDERIEVVRRCDSIDDLIEYSQHYSGYVREAALRRAAELVSPLLLPAIVARLNDWVPQVRTLAQGALLEMMGVVDAKDVLQVLPQVQHLRHAGRTDHAAWIAAFEQACIDRLSWERIADEVLNKDVRIARACFRLLEERQPAISEAVIARLLPASADIVLARHAVEAIAGVPEVGRVRLYQRALRSRFGMVRAIALRPLLAVPGEENDALAARMLTDSQTWVRLIAGTYLGKRGIDSAAILAETLRTPQTNSQVMRACLAGIAELGRADYLGLVRSFTGHPSSRVQVEACLAWLRLAPSAKDEIAGFVLRSPYRRVRRLVLQLMRKHGAYVAPEKALPLMAAHDDVEMMLDFATGRAWDWLELIVQLEPRSCREPALRAKLKQELCEWLDDSMNMYAKPGGAQRVLFQKETTGQALEALLPPHDQVRRRRLAFELLQVA